MLIPNIAIYLHSIAVVSVAILIFCICFCALSIIRGRRF
jgi:hypothetical protein